MILSVPQTTLALSGVATRCRPRAIWIPTVLQGKCVASIALMAAIPLSVSLQPTACRKRSTSGISYALRPRPRPVAQVDSRVQLWATAYTRTCQADGRSVSEGVDNRVTFAMHGVAFDTGTCFREDGGAGIGALNVASVGKSALRLDSHRAQDDKRLPVDLTIVPTNPDLPSPTTILQTLSVQQILRSLCALQWWHLAVGSVAPGRG